MKNKIVVEDLIGLFTVIENKVNETNMPVKQKPKWIKHLKFFAKMAYDLGKNGRVEIEA